MSRALLSCFVAVFFAGTAASAHHTAPGRTHPQVTLTQQLFVDGKPLAAGKYDVYVTDERPAVGAGSASEGQRVVEFAQNGKVIAKDVAEVSASGNQAVRTSGTARGTVQVQKLAGGEFVRIVVTEGGSRYLIHLATSELKQPAPQPQAPARIEITRTPEVAQP